MTQLDTATSLRDWRGADALVSEIPPTPLPSPAHYRQISSWPRAGWARVRTEPQEGQWRPCGPAGNSPSKQGASG